MNEDIETVRLVINAAYRKLMRLTEGRQNLDGQQRALAVLERIEETIPTLQRQRDEARAERDAMRPCICGGWTDTRADALADALRFIITPQENGAILFTEWEDDLDPTACATGYVECLCCGAGGYMNERKLFGRRNSKGRPEHKSDCWWVTVPPLLANRASSSQLQSTNTDSK